MAARAVWKGYLKLSLVSCAVALYPAASSSGRIRFNTLNRHTGNRVKRQFVDAETGEPVEDEDQVKGYAVGKGSYVTIEDEELDALKLQSSHTIDIERFVPRAEVDERYLDTPYYLAPDDRVAQEAFAVIRDAIRDGGMAGIGRAVMSRRERLLLLEPKGQGLLATSLHYAYEVRGEDEVFEGIPEVKYPEEMRDLARHIIAQKAGHFEPATFTDRYEEAVVALVRSKQTGDPVRAKEAGGVQPGNVVNLMEALKRSIAAEGGAGKAEAANRETGKRSGATKGSKAAAKPSAKPSARAGARSEPKPATRRSLKRAS